MVNIPYKKKDCPPLLQLYIPICGHYFVCCSHAEITPVGFFAENKDEKSKKSNQTVIIAASAGGAIVLVAAIVGVVVYLCKR